MSAAYAYEEDDRLVRYLLGRASEEERAETEERIFTDDAVEELLYATADDLMQELLAGRLPPAERQFFESRFLALPRHRERLAFLKDLQAVLQAGARPRQSRRAGWAVAAAAALALLGGALLWSSRQAVAPTRQAAAPSPTAAVPAARTTAAPTPRSPAATRTPAVVATARTPAAPAAVREVRLREPGATADIALAGDVATVRLSVDVDSDAPAFDASIRDREGRSVWSASGLTPAAGDPLVLEVPAALLQAQRYALLIEPEALRSARRAAPVEFTLQVTRR